MSRAARRWWTRILMAAAAVVAAYRRHAELVLDVNDGNIITILKAR